MNEHLYVNFGSVVVHCASVVWFGCEGTKVNVSLRGAQQLLVVNFKTEAEAQESFRLLLKGVTQ